MSQPLTVVNVLVSLLASGIALATPYLYPAMGEMFVQRSGVFNLGIEGIMLMGAFSGFYLTLQTGNPWLGLLAAIAAGVFLGLLMAVFTVTLRSAQGIAGIGIFMLGSGLSSVLFKVGVGNAVSSVQGFSNLVLPGLSDLPVLGKVLFQHNILVYGAYALLPVSWYILFKTPLGLNIRAVGENPQAADCLGIGVGRIRYLTLAIGGAMAGVGGAYLSIASIKVFQEGMTNGIGFIALALVFFGGWRPLGVLAGCLLFSLVNAGQLWLQVLAVPIPYDLAVMAPYVLTIAILALPIVRGHEPAFLGKPFLREEA